MAELCSVCGKKEMLPYKCKFCGWTYCSQHRLPENHECEGLEILKTEARNSGRIVYHPEPEPVRKRNTGIPGLGRQIKSPYAIPISRNYSLYIIMACVVIFFLQQLIPAFTGLFLLIPQLAAIRPWTIFTYMFLHGSGGHLFFNMLVLFFFGPILERKIGSYQFLVVYFGAGLLSALGHMIFSGSPVLGASGAIYGIFACLALLEPEIRVYVYFIPMKIAQALVLFAAIDILMMGSNDMIAHAAHLSGLVFGLYMGLKLKKSVSRSQW
ncbi:MAG: rhomboid family intramembrane serine protease [ANME-2 cluster archaeon]|nr:rhomboid family intramembrane serine protease [ANME-2 cluster archaeon]MDF1530937.1 rhomboid family intramembrane serine protease [ANME-2 cluster archaeon]